MLGQPIHLQDGHLPLLTIVNPLRRGALVLAACAAAAVIGLAGAATAQAHAAAPTHAAYKSSIPAANSVVKVAPTVVSITFLQPLSPKNLSIVVYDKDAKVVSTGSAQISATDLNTATVSMRGDGSDIYRVDWSDVSAEDGDATVGAFVFGVDPSGATDKVPPPPTTTTAQSAVSPLIAALIGLAGIVVGAGATLFSMRRRA
jgi:methionine-rich copper-binding protein CopC